MSNPPADVRAHLATALAGVGVDVHPYPGTVRQPPCIVLRDGSPYLTTIATGADVVGIDVTIEVSTAAGVSALQLSDQLLSAARRALAAAGIVAGPVTRRTDDNDPGLLVAIIPTETPWED